MCRQEEGITINTTATQACPRCGATMSVTIKVTSVDLEIAGVCAECGQETANVIGAGIDQLLKGLGEEAVLKAMGYVQKEDGSWSKGQ